VKWGGQGYKMFKINKIKTDQSSARPFCQPPRRPHLIHIITGDKTGAGTDAPVYVQLIGTHGVSNPFNLDERNWQRKDEGSDKQPMRMFERNQVGGALSPVFICPCSPYIHPVFTLIRS
jgi:hypothetical protein